MKKQNHYWISALLIGSLVTLWRLDFLMAQTPQGGEVARIYNIQAAKDGKRDVRYFRKGCRPQEWCPIEKDNQELIPQDLLITGQVSRADLALIYSSNRREVLFWQETRSLSRFEPKTGTCHFKIEQGKVLYAHNSRKTAQGCQTLTTKEVKITLPLGIGRKGPKQTPNKQNLTSDDQESSLALFIFRKKESQQTLVGVLADNSGEPVIVENLFSGKTTKLKAGEYTIASADGKLESGRFGLQAFYQDNRDLTLGLWSNPEDEEYVQRQPIEIKDILEKVRKETLDAVKGQDKPGPFDSIGRPEIPNFPTGDNNVESTPSPATPPVTTPPVTTPPVTTPPVTTPPVTTPPVTTPPVTTPPVTTPPVTTPPVTTPPVTTPPVTTPPSGLI